MYIRYCKKKIFSNYTILTYATTEMNCIIIYKISIEKDYIIFTKTINAHQNSLIYTKLNFSMYKNNLIKPQFENI